MDELGSLIDRLEKAQLLDDVTAEKLYRASFEDAFDRMLDEGVTYGVATGALGILNQSESDFRAELKLIDNNLTRQVQIVDESLDNWFAKGDLPPPYYPWRIAVILSKAKRLDEERQFLAAWCRHFGNRRGRRYEDLAARARKRGVTV